MSHDLEGSVFSAMFLERIDPDVDVTDALTEEGVGEADTAGPWSLRPRPDGQWEVVTEGRAPAATLSSYAIGLLVAAALPALGRRFFRSAAAEEGGPGARLLLDASEEPVGQLTAVHEETLTAYLNVLEYLRRSPLDLARLMYAARGPALKRAGAILFIWEQAGR
jgi:hypothetical protein